MNSIPLKQFLDDLDKIIDSNQKASGNRDSRMKCTSQLLGAADELYNASTTINTRQADGTFRSHICGSTSIEEVYNGEQKKRAVVDLVQQGGTMLGIGLLGYTYIMEKSGVRFRNMAGTSAGAINTLLISALPEKIYTEASLFNPGCNAVKSELLAYLVANENFSQFLDRKGIIGKLQGLMIRHIKGMGKILTVMKFLLPVLMIVASFGIYRLLYKKLFNTANHLTETQVNNYNFISGTLGILMVVLLVLVIIFGILRKNMGVNPGEKPYKWLRSILETRYVNVYTTSDLMTRKKKETQPTYTPPLGGDALAFKDPRLVFIAANLTHNRIVKFPENSDDYWNKNFNGNVTPAAFVRASMSLPFIYYTFIPSDCHVQGYGNNPPKGTVDMLARFVDGGMLSNFPIREFHTPAGVNPRYPTFGVLLGNLPAEPGKDTESIRRKFGSLSVFKYVLSFISTFRNFYDSDFLRSHKEFNMLVKSVNTDQFNSLDFGMTFSTKKDLFCEGAKTAINQLEKFDWNAYIEVRKE